MKKILLAAMAVIAFTACSQNEDLEKATQNREMKFNTAVMKNTRATVVSSTNFKKFTLYAYQGTTEMITGVLFSKSVDTWSAAGNAKFYWPGDEAVTFYGYSVETMADATFAKTGATPTLAYTVKTTATAQEDLLVALDTKKYSQSSSGTVNMAFSHALAKMSFKVKGAGDSGISYSVTGVTISAKGTGTYTYGGTWATSGENATYTVLSGSPQVVTGGAEAIALLSDTYMMMPQSGATVTVNYTYTANGVTTTATPKTLNFPEWVKGSNVSYTLTLDGANEIKITGSTTDDWNSAGADTSFTN